MGLGLILMGVERYERMLSVAPKTLLTTLTAEHGVFTEYKSSSIANTVPTRQGKLGV
jgi:hypothetical protein